MSIANTKTKIVYMDESGNKESDRFFVIGFLEIVDAIEFNSKLMRIRDQIFHKSAYNRRQRVEKLYAEKNIDELFNFSKNYSQFELKFDKITPDNMNLFKDLLTVLFNKIDFKFTALVIDRKDPKYKHNGLVGMYKALLHIYSEKCIKEKYIFIPDMFDPQFNWYDINFADKVEKIIPATSDSAFPLQVVDILTGVVGLGLRINLLKGEELSNSDEKRRPILESFEKIIKRKIASNFTSHMPKYVSVWTIDFGKTWSKR